MKIIFTLISVIEFTVYLFYGVMLSGAFIDDPFFVILFYVISLPHAIFAIIASLYYESIVDKCTNKYSLATFNRLKKACLIFGGFSIPFLIYFVYTCILLFFNRNLFSVSFVMFFSLPTAMYLITTVFFFMIYRKARKNPYVMPQANA